MTLYYEHGKIDAMLTSRTRYIARATLIPFLHDLTFNLDTVEEVNRVKPELFGAVRACIRMGHKMEMLPPSDLQELKNDIIEATAKTIDERLAIGYARLLWLTLQVHATLCPEHHSDMVTINILKLTYNRLPRKYTLKRLKLRTSSTRRWLL